MIKRFLASAAALAMMTGVACAQSTSSDSTMSTQTTTSAPAVGTYNSRSTQQGTDINGNASVKSQTYHSGVNGTSATSNSRTTSPDGSLQSTTHEGQTASPDGSSAYDKSTTTTTTH